jgi:hypothetical protein
MDWFADVADHERDIGSQCLVVPVPAGWGRSTVLERFVHRVNIDDDIRGVATVVSGVDAPDDPTLQAQIRSTRPTR